MIRYGHIDPIWNLDILAGLKYVRRDLSESKNAGLDIYHWNDIDDRDRYGDQIALEVADEFVQELFWKSDPWPNLQNKFVVIHQMRPGMIQPIHGDLYRRYSINNNITDIETIKRVLVFLSDWQPGHVFHCGDRSYDNWRAGDWVQWSGTTPHMAGNFGSAPRYTMQITGFTK
jgi:hypothetical protein